MKTTGYNSCTSWVATIACSLIGFFIMTPIRLPGLFFVAIIDGYNIDRKTATLPIVIFGVLRSITGPAIGYVGQRVGLRATTTLGCLLSAIGIGACYFAENIIILTIFLGFLYGTGLGFGISLLPEILKQHFNKDVNLAIGIAAAGPCLGAIIMPKILQFLLNEFGASGMFLILSAILLNSVPAALLLKDPKNSDSKQRFQIPNELTQVTKDYNITMYEKKGVNNLAFVPLEEDISESELNEINKRGNIYCKLTFENKGLSQSHIDSISEVKKCSNDKREIDDSRKDLNYESGSTVENLELFNDNQNKQCKSFRLFRDPTFHLLMIIHSSYGFIITMTWTILLDFSRDIGISFDTSLYFLTFLPISEIIGNLGLNWITDRYFMTITKYIMTCYLIVGMAIMLIVFTHNFALMMVGVLIFGCITGSLTAVLPGMIFELIEQDQQSMAMTSRFLLYAFLALTKTPLVGYFRGTLGSYDGVFYVLILVCIFCAILVNFTPILASLRKKNKLIQTK